METDHIDGRPAHTAPPRRCYTDEEVGVPAYERFVLELEFVQCLANPLYLNWMATRQYYDNPAFVKFLDYLKYWKRPEYAKFLTYPHCLFFLDLLQDSDFRTAIKDFSYAEHIRQQQDSFFANFLKNRLTEAAGNGVVGS